MTFFRRLFLRSKECDNRAEHDFPVNDVVAKLELQIAESKSSHDKIKLNLEVARNAVKNLKETNRKRGEAIEKLKITRDNLNERIAKQLDTMDNMRSRARMLGKNLAIVLSTCAPLAMGSYRSEND